MLGSALGWLGRGWVDGGLGRGWVDGWVGRGWVGGGVRCGGARWVAVVGAWGWQSLSVSPIQQVLVVGACRRALLFIVRAARHPRREAGMSF